MAFEFGYVFSRWTVPIRRLRVPPGLRQADLVGILSYPTFSLGSEFQRVSRHSIKQIATPVTSESKARQPRIPPEIWLEILRLSSLDVYPARTRSIYIRRIRFAYPGHQTQDRRMRSANFCVRRYPRNKASSSSVTRGTNELGILILYEAVFVTRSFLVQRSGLTEGPAAQIPEQEVQGTMDKAS